MTSPCTAWTRKALCLLVLGSVNGALSAQTPATGTPTVALYTISDLDDPKMIRQVQPLKGSEEWLTPVGADDSVTDCQPFDAPTDLAVRSCEVIRARGRFVHALDASGTAQSGSRAMGILFRVIGPGQSGGLSPAPPPIGSQNTKPVLRDAGVLRLAAEPQKFIEPAPSLWADINAKGRVTRCRIRISTGTDAGDAELCRRMTKAKFDPARDPQGNKVPALYAYFAFKVVPQG